MYYSDNSIKGVGSVQQTTYENKVVKRSDGETKTSQPTESFGPAVELSDSLKEYLNHLNIALGSCGEFHSCYESFKQAN